MVNSMEPSILISLMNPEAYPVPASAVELIQTHVSWIFLTDTHAFKIKKPVNFGFLDFSTIEKRFFYCNEEVRLNRRLCPDIYEGVIDLRADDGGASFIGCGPVIDHAVMMKRLPADRMLDRLVENGEASEKMIESISDVISRFHAEAATSKYISGFGTLDMIMTNWSENFVQMLQYSDSTLPASDLASIRSWVNEFAEGNRELFSRRIEQGFIRECDGDLHLENICLVEDRIYIFDCIEFNERFRFCDTAADIAFLLMDLDFHGRSDLSAAALAAYTQSSGDRDIAKLITFYRVYRAFVRGKVESFLLNDSTTEIRIKDMAKKRAIRYFRLARGYCERTGLRPTLFITCGTMGCGKSTLADQLAFELDISACNSDTVRKKNSGLTPETSGNEPYEKGLYDKAITDRVYKKLETFAGDELAAGRSVLIDASFKRASDRAACASLAARHGADFVILWVSCDENEQHDRLVRRSADKDSVSDGRLELLDQQKSKFEFPQPEEGRIIKVNSMYRPDQLTSRIYEELQQ